jgi:hypothetical protein
MPRVKSPSTIHMVWRVTYYAQMVADALRAGRYGLALRLGLVLREAERELRRISVIILVPISLLCN